MAIHNLAGFLVNRRPVFAVLLCIFFPALATAADTIEVKLPTGITATALHHSGRPSQPALLLLPGFLQTHHSPPLSSLAGNLASKGYTVLSPTISLGINRRNQAMACEAVHTHTMAEDVAEVAYWINWLSNKGYKNIVLIGYSTFGNHEILFYNAQGSHPAIKKVILISLTPVFHDKAERQKILGEMDAKRDAGNKKLGKFTLGYCKNNFTATRQSYLSYAQIDENKILGLLRHTPVPTEVVLGSVDTIPPANWVSQLKAQMTQVTLIGNANHFFEDTSEFDLAEEVESILKKLPGK